MALSRWSGSIFLVSCSRAASISSVSMRLMPAGTVSSFVSSNPTKRLQNRAAGTAFLFTLLRRQIERFYACGAANMVHQASIPPTSWRTLFAVNCCAGRRNAAHAALAHPLLSLPDCTDNPDLTKKLETPHERHTSHRPVHVQRPP